MARLLTRNAYNILFACTDLKHVFSNRHFHLSGRGIAKPLLKVKYKPLLLNRQYVGLAARLIRGVLKIRYLVLGSAVGGGVTLSKKYAEWRDGLPDMSWLDQLLPDSQQFNMFTKSLLEVKDNIKNSIEAENAGGRILKELSEMRLNLTNRLENARLAANFGKSNNDEENVVPTKGLQAQNTKIFPINRYQRSIMSLEDRDMNSLPDDVRAELITLKSKFRKRMLQIRRNTNSKISLFYQDIQNELKRRPTIVNLNKKLIIAENIPLPQIRLPMVLVLGSNENESSAVVAALVGIDLLCRIRESDIEDKNVPPKDDQQKSPDDSTQELLSRRAVEIELLEGVESTATIFSEGEEHHFDLSDERQLLQCQRFLAALTVDKSTSDPVNVRVYGDYQQPMVLVYAPYKEHADRVSLERYSREQHTLVIHLQNCHKESNNDKLLADLIKSSDPDRKRSILALTGLHQMNKSDLERLKSFVDGEYLDTFCLAIDPFNSDSIKNMLKDEESFFKSSPLVRNGTIKVTKSMFPSLRYQILERCQKIFLQNIEKHINEFLSVSQEQDTIWRRIYGTHTRPLDSEEVLKRASVDILDKISNLKRVKLSENGWCKVAEAFLVNDMVDAVMDKVINTGKGSIGLGESSLYGSVGTRSLQNWISSSAGKSAVIRAAHHALRHQLSMHKGSKCKQGPFDSVITDTATKISEVILQSYIFESTDKESEAVSILSSDILEESEILEESDWDKSVTLLEESIWRHQKIAIDKNETSFLKHAKERLKTCKHGFRKHQIKDHNEIELDCPEVILFYKIQQIALVMSRSLRQEMLERHADKVEKLARSVAADLIPDPSSSACLQMAEDINHVRRLLQLLENLKKSLKPED